MIKILSTRRFGLFWNLFRRWLKRELNILLAAINSVAESIDFKPVEDKVDDAKSTVISSRNAVQASVSGSTAAVNAHTTEERENIMGGKMVTYEEDYLPAAQYGTDNTDFRPVIIGDMDYTISEDDAFGLANGVAVGTVFRVMEDNSGDEHDMMSVPKTVDETTLTVALYGSEPTIEGVTEWLNFEKDKCYIVTGVYEVADGEGDTWLVYTFEEYEPGRSGKEIYDKVDEVKEAVENINVESADQLAAFFGLPEALPSGYEFMQDSEVTDDLEDIMQALDPELLQEVEYPEGSGTYMTKAQAITAEAMQIINPSQS